MTRRDRDWDRPIPQRQPTSAQPSRLLRGIGGEHIPDTPPALQPLNRATMAELRAQVTRQRDNRAAESMRMFTMPRNVGRTVTFDPEMYQTLFNDTIQNMTLTTAPPRVNAGTASTEGSINWGNLRWRNDQEIARAQIQTIRLSSDPQHYTFNTDLAEDTHSEVSARARTVFRNQVQRAASRIGMQIQNNITQRLDVEQGMDGLTPITGAQRFESRNPTLNRVADFDGDVINSVTTDVNNSGSYFVNTNGIGSTQPFSMGVKQEEVSERKYTMDEIKEWLKANLEVKTQVFESDGEVSVTTTLVLDGEEFSSDTDSAVL